MPPPSQPSQPSAERASLNVAPGEVLGGKFRVERVVGKGGMGVVLEATNTVLDQRVALKLLATGASDAAGAERFANEARAAARLKSEHVARVYDVGSDPRCGPFIVMELLEGKTLAELLAVTGRIAPARAVEYVIDACEGLAEAHARGIVHQDVKPANLFLVTGADGRPCIKLLDFGIATMRSKEPARDGKSSGPTAGTPAYLAPEQLRRLPDADHRADIWALGCVLHELLAGERAFRAERFTELVTKILEEAPRPLPADVAALPELVAVLNRCLEKDPAKRFASTGALALALLPFARSRAHSVAAKAAAQVKAAGLDPGLVVPSSMPPRPSESHIIEVPSVNLRAAALPTISEAPTEPAIAGSRAPAGPAASSSSRLFLILALVFVAVGAGALVVALRRPATPATSALSSPPSNAPTSSATSSTAGPSTEAPAAAASSPLAGEPPATPTPSAADEPRAAVSASSTPRAPRAERARPAPSAKPPPSSPASARADEFDIRPTR